MGPVSFEPMDGGSTRDDALNLAAKLADAGIRVASITAQHHHGRQRFQLLIRSDDATRAHRIAESTGLDEEPSP